MYRPYLLLLFGLVALGIAVGVVCYQSRGKLTPEQVAEKHGLVLVKPGLEYYYCDRLYDAKELRELTIRNPDKLTGVVRVSLIKNSLGEAFSPPNKWGSQISTNNLVLDGDPEIIKRILPDLD